VKLPATKRPHAQAARIILASLSFLFCFAWLLSAQVPAEVSEVFRQASEAMQRGDLDVAGDGFAAAAKAAPAFAEAHFNLGLVREEQGRFDEAIASFQKALALKPRLHGANLFLGIAYFRLNQLDKALAAIQKESASYSQDAAAWMWLGVVRLAQDKPEEAAEALDMAATLAPDDMDVLYHRGRAHLLVSKNSYAKMFKAGPKSWRVHQVLAQANAEAGRHTDAVAEYLAAIKLAPTQPGLHEELGSEYRSLGKVQEAEESFLRELEIAPHSVLAKYELGVLAVEQGDGAKGKVLIDSALKEKPGLLHSDYNLGRAEMLLGNDAAAAQLLGRATSAAGSDPEVIQQAWYQLGIVYRHLHRMEDAQKAMATFQKLKDEDSENSQNRLKRYEAEHNPTSSQPPPSPENPQ
jgi:tetratricopeptide (TPR) repeat protein